MAESKGACEPGWERACALVSPDVGGPAHRDPPLLAPSGERGGGGRGTGEGGTGELQASVPPPPSPAGWVSAPPASLLELCNPGTWQLGEQRRRGAEGKEDRREAGPGEGVGSGKHASGWDLGLSFRRIPGGLILPLLPAPSRASVSPSSF